MENNKQLEGEEGEEIRPEVPESNRPRRKPPPKKTYEALRRAKIERQKERARRDYFEAHTARGKYHAAERYLGAGATFFVTPGLIKTFDRGTGDLRKRFLDEGLAKQSAPRHLLSASDYLASEGVVRGSELEKEFLEFLAPDEASGEEKSSSSSSSSEASLTSESLTSSSACSSDESESLDSEDSETSEEEVQVAQPEEKPKRLVGWYPRAVVRFMGSRLRGARRRGVARRVKLSDGVVQRFWALTKETAQAFPETVTTNGKLNITLTAGNSEFWARLKSTLKTRGPPETRRLFFLRHISDKLKTYFGKYDNLGYPKNRE